MAGVPMSSPMAAMIQMRMNQPQPLGAGATAGGSTIPGQTNDFGGQDNGGTAPPPDQSDPLAALASSANPNGGNVQQGAQLVAAIQKLLPLLVLAEHHNGTFELDGPAQEQFLGAAAARHMGAKLHSVHNAGKGQRLHIAV